MLSFEERRHRLNYIGTDVYNAIIRQTSVRINDWFKTIYNLLKSRQRKMYKLMSELCY